MLISSEMKFDYSDWDYNTINKRPLGGTESAFYNLSNVISEKYSVFVFTKTKKITKIHNRLCYYPLDKCDKILQAMKPDIIIFQGITSIQKNILQISIQIYCYGIGYITI